MITAKEARMKLNNNVRITEKEKLNIIQQRILEVIEHECSELSIVREEHLINEQIADVLREDGYDVTMDYINLDRYLEKDIESEFWDDYTIRF